MVKRGIILFFSLFILIGCSSNEKPLERLNTPRNLEIHKDVLTFDPVDKATSYILNINGEMIEITETTYTFLEEGEYRVKVKAIAEGFLDSLYSQVLEFNMIFLDYPKDIQAVNNRIVFEPVEGADSYNIEINGVVYNSILDIVPSLEVGTYQVRIQAISDQYVDSDFSPVVTIDILERQKKITSNEYTYSLKSTSDLLIYDYEENEIILNYDVSLITYHMSQTLEKVVLNIKDEVYIKNDAFYINSKFLINLPQTTKASYDNTYTIHLTTNLGQHDITIKFNQKDTVYLISESIVTSDFKHDVKFIFDVFDYTLDKITSNTFEVKDQFTFEDGILRVNIDFITNYFKENPGVKELNFKVEFINKDKTSNVSFNLSIRR